MYILSQKKDLVVNTDKITSFSVFNENEYFDNEKPNWILSADDWQLGEFDSEKDAKGVIEEILSIIVNGQRQVYDIRN